MSPRTISVAGSIDCNASGPCNEPYALEADRPEALEDRT
jgi:hypothetical protein